MRSYSMNSDVGTIFCAATINGGTDNGPVGSPVDGAWLPGANYTPSRTIWRVYGTGSSFYNPGPSETYVIIDDESLGRVFKMGF